MVDYLFGWFGKSHNIASPAPALDPQLGLRYDLMFIVKVERPDRTGRYASGFHIVEQRCSVIAHMAFSGDAFGKVKARNFVGAGLKAVTATSEELCRGRPESSNGNQRIFSH
jgi:hypothetical protein